MGLIFASWAISISEGTGRRSFSFVAMNPGFLPLVRAETTVRLAGVFFATTFYLGRAFLTYDLVAIEISFDMVLLLTITTMNDDARLSSFPIFWDSNMSQNGLSY
jgi:hypothetical protein